ncbi:MAG: ribonuclease P protein component [Bacteroidota bacterium]|nr:ribonuclease P protein component [Bacteroidota bacterium]
MKSDFSYGAIEKLKSRKLLEQVFTKGRSFSVFPLKVFYILVDEPLNFPLKTGVGVSSRNFKKATDRNRIKRLLREAYRLNKKELLQKITDEKKQVAVFFLYIDKTLPSLAIVQQKMMVALDKLANQVSEKNTSNT